VCAERWSFDERSTNVCRVRNGVGEQVLHKTYPSNSGPSPTGAEQALEQLVGSNRMCTELTALLLLQILQGNHSPECLPYMESLLTHQLYGFETALGFGLPPGTGASAAECRLIGRCRC
jgi:hypothetical protein